MSGWVDVCAEGELPAGVKRTAQVGGHTVVLLRHEGLVYALDSECPHRGGPLGEGDLLGADLYCPLHAWPFDVRTGKCTLFPEAQVRVFDVRVEAGRILVAPGGRFT